MRSIVAFSSRANSASLSRCPCCSLPLSLSMGSFFVAAALPGDGPLRQLPRVPREGDEARALAAERAAAARSAAPDDAWRWKAGGGMCDENERVCVCCSVSVVAGAEVVGALTISERPFFSCLSVPTKSHHGYICMRGC